MFYDMKLWQVEGNSWYCICRLKCPDVYTLAESCGCAWSIVATKWFICLFVDVIPVEVGHSEFLSYMVMMMQIMYINGLKNFIKQSVDWY